jgi:hypothetical protein
VRQTRTEEQLAQAQRDLEEMRLLLGKERTRNQFPEQQPVINGTAVAATAAFKNGQQHEYRAARIGDQAFLPLRDRPGGSSRKLKAIPYNAAGILSSCKLAVYGNAVFVEASYQGTTGWLSGYYLARLR